MSGTEAKDGGAPQSLELVAVHLLNRLSRADAAQADDRINEALAMLGEIAGFDRTYLFWLRDGRLLDNTHEWTAPGIDPMIDDLQGLPIELYGSLWQPFERDEHVFIPNVAKMPDAQSEERELLSQQGIRSLLLVPVVDAGKPVGMVGYDVVRHARAFTDGDILLLRAVANGIGSLKMRLGADIALRNSHDLIEATLNALPDLIIQVDRNQRIELVHPSTDGSELLTVDKLLGKTLDEVLPPDIAQIAREMIGSLDGGGPNTGRRYALSVEGQERWFEARLAEWRSAQGGYVFIIRDITGEYLAAQQEEARMRQLQEIVELEAKLRQSQKMEAVGQLTGGIAHDFNNLITIILGNSEVLADSLTGDPDSRRRAENIIEAAERGAMLTSRLLSFARLQTLDPKVIDPGQLLGEITGLIRHTIEENVEIEIVVAPGMAPGMTPGDWLIEVDPGQLENAILNLVINARDAMPDGGRVTIEAADVTLGSDGSRDRHGDAAGLPDGRYVRISVSDTGSGMSREVMERAFDPFFTTKETGKGTGLGLSMVWGFLQQSNGHARIQSEPGKGTSVQLYFPVTTREPELSQAAQEDVTELVGGTERILIVEDDHMVRMHVVEQIANLGYEVQEAASAAQALDVMRNSQPFDLLFTDIVMPGGMNGRQLADEALLRYPGLKVLFTSGYTQDAELHQRRLDGDIQLLGKPYRPWELASRIRSVLDG